ncbi:MAG TPA: hypothetical protein VEX39_06655 [Thermoleophilaceae bacterium]|nr:hypothetical protein [Thermoleophilaceae bacterium]
MTPRKLQVPVPRLALLPREAAGALGVSEQWFNEHVRPSLRLTRVESKVLVPVSELERFLIESAERTLPGAGR